MAKKATKGRAGEAAAAKAPAVTKRLALLGTRVVYCGIDQRQHESRH